MIFDRQTAIEWLEVFAGAIAFFALMFCGYAIVSVVSIMMGN